MSPTTLYRLFDGSLRLLYVGIAGNPGRRFEQHAKDKAWWSDVAHITTEHHPTREAAANAEVAAIRAEAPLYNVAHKPRASGESAQQVQLVCSACHTAVEPSEMAGYLEVDMSAVGRVERAWRERERSRLLDEADGPVIRPLSELMSLPGRVAWNAWHRGCDPQPEKSDVYWIGADRLTTWADVMQWTAHLMDKSWFEHTNWSTVLHHLSDEDASEGPLRGVQRDQVPA